jgi:hypothetical protein
VIRQSADDRSARALAIDQDCRRVVLDPVAVDEHAVRHVALPAFRLDPDAVAAQEVFRMVVTLAAPRSVIAVLLLDGPVIARDEQLSMWIRRDLSLDWNQPWTRSREV